MEIYIKIGTMSQDRVKVKARRSRLPKVGETLQVRSSANKYAGWETVRITEIKDVGYPLYHADRW